MAKGYSQEKGIDFEESFSPVVDKATLRIFLTIAAELKLKLIQFDVPSAFTRAELKEEVYVKLPIEFYPEGAGKVYRLRKALYGLKQAPLAFFNHMKSILGKIGMNPSTVDRCFFFRTNGSSSRTDGYSHIHDMMTLHVDDGLAAIPPREEKTMVEFLKNELDATISDIVEQHLGIDVRRTKDGIYISQTNYIERLMQRFSVESRHWPKIPMTPKIDLQPKLPNEAETGFPYKELVGALIYIGCCTRPDISFAVNKLAQFYSQPTDAHYSAALQVLSYLGGTADAELHLGRRGTDRSELKAYFDSDFAEDKVTRKSVSGTIIFLDNSPVMWSSKRQRIIAQSSTEAEYLAVYYGRNDLIYLQNFLTSIGINIVEINSRSTVMQDNMSTIALITDNNSRGRTQYFDVKLRI